MIMATLTVMDWLAAGALMLVFLLVGLRTEVLNPRFEWGPSAPFLERLVWDGLAAAAALRGIMIFSDEVQATGSEATLCVALVLVVAVGFLKTLYYALAPRIIDALIW